MGDIGSKPIVIELADFVAGPFCGKMLAGMGFVVVKVQAPGAADGIPDANSVCGWPPYPKRQAVGLYLDAGKMGVTLNLEHPSGLRLFRELAREASILVEDRRPGFMAARGLAYDQLSASNPRLNMVSITPFGQSGPHSLYKAYYLNTYHAGGDGYLQGDSRPTKGPGYLGEYQAGVSATIASLAAYYHTRVTGQGQHVDVSKQESLLFTNRALAAAYANTGMLETRSTRAFAYGGRFRCKDGYIILVANENAQWAALAEVIGRPELARDERFKDFATRSAHSKEIRVFVEAWAEQITCKEAYNQGQAKRIPIGVFHDVAQAMTWPQFLGRGLFGPIVEVGGKSLTGPTWPIWSSETIRGGPKRSLEPGEHNARIYSEWLGHDSAELQELAKAGVI